MPATADLRAGAAKVSITPNPHAIPYQLGGYVDVFRVGHNAKGIHDTCYARALVLTDGTNKCAIVSLDLCFMPANVKTAVAQRVASTGIPASGLFLSCTHTHSAPDPLALHSANTQPAGPLSTFSQPLLDFIADHIAQAITEANGRLRPARAGSGQMDGLGLNRNRRGEKLTDDQMTALKVTDADGRPLAAAFVYAAHPVYFGSTMLDVSGDWSGAFERQMEAVMPGAVVLFLNGAEGDASPNGADEGTAEERIETYSARICEKARALHDRIAAAPDAKVAAWTQTTELGSPVPHPFFLLAAAGLKATAQQARDLVNRLMPTQCEVSFVRVGDALLMGVPGEPTAAVGLAAKATARAQTASAGIKSVAIVALTNGWLGYLPTAEQYRAGKYEAVMSFYGDGIARHILAGLDAGVKAMPGG